MSQPQIRTLATQISAELFRIEHPNQDIVSDAMACLDRLAEFLPSGSGFDSGTTLDVDQSTPEKLVFDTSFHAMNEYGYYDGWTEHKIIARPSFVFGMALDEPSSDDPDDDTQEYIWDTFTHALQQDIEAYRDHTYPQGSGIAYRRVLPAVDHHC